MKQELGKLMSALGLACGLANAAPAPPPRAEVVHWWTSGGESAALKVIASRYRAAGGVWIDTAVIGGEQARAVSINRIIGGTPPVAAQFNTSKQFLDLIEEDMLENVDDVARKFDWDRTLPEPVRNVIKVAGHYYAVPVSIHMPTWIWYSQAAFKKARIRKAPASMDEVFTTLDALKAAGIVPLAHGGEPWQLNILFMAMLANTVDKETYLNVFRNGERRAIRSEGLRRALLSFKRLRNYVDRDWQSRRWNDTTAMILEGQAGIHIMGDWVKGEILAAGMRPGVDIGCMASLGDDAPLVIQGDAFIFPRSERPAVRRAQKLLSAVMVAPETQLAFSRAKGSIPLSVTQDSAALDPCTRTAIALVKQSGRHVGNGETYLTAGQNGALERVLGEYWTSTMSVETAQQRIAAALGR